MGTCRRAGSRPRRGTMIKLLLLLVLSQGTLQSPRRQQARHYDQDWMKYMIGEVFFKENSNQGNQQIFEDDYSEDDDTEEIPYSVLERYNGYKKRYQSRMFMELFRYISGVNQKQEEIDLTRPVVVFHNVTKETPLGNYEDVCMCFYLPSKYQADHQHTDQHDQRTSRHVAEVPPQPLANGAVYIYTAPAHHVFVRRFGGYALTHNHWEREMKALEADLCLINTGTSRVSTTLLDTTAHGRYTTGEMKYGCSALRNLWAPRWRTGRNFK